jgi:hypothetical protein
VLGLLLSPLGRFLGIAAALVLVLGLVRHSGAESVRKAYAQREAEAVAKATVTAAADAQMSAGLRDQFAQAQAATQVRKETIIKRIPIYVSKAADSRCVLGSGFVRAYDAAALGLPAPATGTGGSDEAASGVALSQHLELDVGNLSAGRNGLDEAGKWRAWYAALAAKPAKPKKRWGLF